MIKVPKIKPGPYIAFAGRFGLFIDVAIDEDEMSERVHNSMGFISSDDYADFYPGKMDVRSEGYIAFSNYRPKILKDTIYNHFFPVGRMYNSHYYGEDFGLMRSAISHCMDIYRCEIFQTPTIAKIKKALKDHSQIDVSDENPVWLWFCSNWR